MTAKNDVPTCCFCCHVKVGTFILSTLVLLGGMFMVVMTSLLLAGAIEVDPQSGFYESDVTNTDPLYSNMSMYQRSTLWIGLGNGFVLLIIASLAIYGLMKNRAGYLLPFFIIQLFNFLCTIVSIGSIMFYWPSVKRRITECQSMPDDWKMWLQSIDDRWLALMVFGFMFAVLMIKSSLVSMTYRTYKHITCQVLIRQREDPEINCVADSKPDFSPIYTPPKYEDIQKVPLVTDMEDCDMNPPPYKA